MVRMRAPKSRAQALPLFDAVVSVMDSSRKMLKNAYLGARIGFDAEENGPSKIW